jgi:hypothetical protein
MWRNYGVFWDGSRKMVAHRYFMALPLPVGKLVCHRCDNPICIRPSHLFIGTQSDNVQDCMKKGRHKWSLDAARLNQRCKKGEGNGSNKLTNDQVQEILSEPGRKGINIALARKFGVSGGLIGLIRSRKRWTHIQPTLTA